MKTKHPQQFAVKAARLPLLASNSAQCRVDSGTACSKQWHTLRNAGLAVLALAATMLGPLARAADSPDAVQSQGNPYRRWQNGPSGATAELPIAVWLQDPRNAAKYRDIGINLYVALWDGPTQKQLDELRRHGMPVICDQNAYARAHLDEKLIVGWMHGDEPDNAQSLPGGKGYGPPIPPRTIVDDYQRIRKADPTRPVMLNLGQGVAWDGWYGRGVRSNHPEDYAEYVQGGDIVSFDIYPAVHDRREVAGKLWYVARGVRRLIDWAGPQRIVWNCIECTRISNVKTKPTPEQVRAEVWMALIHGSQGLIYFCHEFKPRFIEAGLLADDQMARAVGAINRQAQQLAPVLRSAEPGAAATVQVTPSAVAADMARLLGRQGIAVATRRHKGATYVFAVRMESTPAAAVFHVPGLPGEATATVVGEDRSIPVRDGRFDDQFKPDAVHIYRIDGKGI